jgi:hypothetical protein
MRIIGIFKVNLELWDEGSGRLDSVYIFILPFVHQVVPKHLVDKESLELPFRCTGLICSVR